MEFELHIILRAMFLILMIDVSFSVTHATKEDANLTDIINMAKSFNEHYKIMSWAVYYKKQYSAKSLVNTMKDSSFYISFHDISNNSELPWNNERTLHLYLAQDLQYLNQRLHKYISYKKNDGTGSINQHFVCDNIWLVQKKNSTGWNDFRSLPLSLDSCFFVFQNTMNDTEDLSLSIKEVYKIDKRSNNLEINDYGKWRTDQNITINETNIWKRRSNLKGTKIGVISFVWPNMVTYAENGCNSSNCFKGYFADLFHNVQTLLNFTYDLTIGDGYGRKMENGSWTSSIGLLLESDAELAIAPFAYTVERIEVLNYLYLISPEYGRLYIRNPEETFDWKIYTKPFRGESWIGTFLFCLSSPILFRALMHNWTAKSLDAASLKDCYLTVLKSLIGMDYDIRTLTMAKRISYFSIVIGAMLIYWWWEAMLITYFSFPLVTLPFNSLEELLTKSDEKVIILRDSVHEDHFRLSKDLITQRVWEERIKPYIDDPVYRTDWCSFLDKVVEDPSYVAYIKAYKGRLRLCKMYTECRVIPIPQIVSKNFGGGWILPKNSPFYPILSYYVSLIKESGSYYKIKATYDSFVGPDQICDNYDGKAIGMHKIFSLLGVILVGILISAFLFIVEYLVPSSLFDNFAFHVSQLKEDNFGGRQSKRKKKSRVF